MTGSAFAALSGAAAWMAAVHLIGGGLLGFLYFRGLWWNAHLFARRGAMLMAVSLMIGRFGLLGGTLALIGSTEGWPLMLATALGLFLARLVIVRRLAGAPA